MIIKPLIFLNDLALVANFLNRGFSTLNNHPTDPYFNHQLPIELKDSQPFVNRCIDKINRDQRLLVHEDKKLSELWYAFKWRNSCGLSRTKAKITFQTLEHSLRRRGVFFDLFSLRQHFLDTHLSAQIGRLQPGDWSALETLNKQIPWDYLQDWHNQNPTTNCMFESDDVPYFCFVMNSKGKKEAIIEEVITTPICFINEIVKRDIRERKWMGISGIEKRYNELEVRKARSAEEALKARYKKTPYLEWAGKRLLNKLDTGPLKNHVWINDLIKFFFYYLEKFI